MWEANHVWLIFVLVVLWTVFPPVFAAIASTLYIPLTVAAVGIIFRGSGFAFRKSIDHPRWQQTFGAVFALSSVLTPFFLGTIAGAVASGRVPPGNAAGDVVSSWVNPTSLLVGTLAVAISAYLAATYLTADAERAGERDLAVAFARRAVITATFAGAVSICGIWVVARDAPRLFDALTTRGLPLVVISGLGGITSIWLLWSHRYVHARVAAGAAVGAVVWGWGIAQYPYMLVGHLTVGEAAAGEATVTAVLVSLVVGAVVFVPALIWMYLLFQREENEKR